MRERHYRGSDGLEISRYSGQRPVRYIIRDFLIAWTDRAYIRAGRISWKPWSRR